MAKNFHTRTNITAKHYTIFLEEKILEFFMAPIVKHTLVSSRRRFQPLNMERKVWVIEKFWKLSNSASKNMPEIDIFPHGSKFLLTSAIFDIDFPCFI